MIYSRQIYNIILFFIYMMSNVAIITRLDGQRGFKVTFLIVSSICLLSLFETPKNEDAEK